MFYSLTISWLTVLELGFEFPPPDITPVVTGPLKGLAVPGKQTRTSGG